MMFYNRVALAITCLVFTIPAVAATDPYPLQPLPGPLAAWQTVEFAPEYAPAGNPYDPDLVRLDAQIATPSGAVAIPGFWYQPQARTLEHGRETLAPGGPAGWRIRFLPRQPGPHKIRAVLTEQGAEKAAWEGEFEVKPAATAFTGLVRVEPQQKRYFMLDDGANPPRPFPLVGANACWHHLGGTSDYEAWFAEFQKNGMNYTRLWMWPLSFAIEVLPGERLNYNQEKAWQLDKTLDLAAQHGIRVMLCLDFHGIFQTRPDYWNANDDWPRHPYNATNGGPCATQNEFFTNTEAQALYRKRLRYIVARYASHPALMSWQFFNEINNVYEFLNPPDVVAWHALMADWLKASDPCQHLVTTSFSGSDNHADIWTLSGLDYTQRHTYLDGLETSTPPVPTVSQAAQYYHDTFAKPFYIGEYGITWKGFLPELDPFYRGMRQGVWAGIMCGTAGTGMSWWWERIHEKNLYPIWKSVATFIADTHFGSAAWHPLDVPQGETLSARAMTDGKTTLLWLLDKRYEYPANATAEAEPYAGESTYTLPLPDGTYEVAWYDVPATRFTAPEATRTTLQVPPFKETVAAKVTKK